MVAFDGQTGLPPIAGDNFNNPGNWVPAQVPTDTAFFGPTLPNGRSPLIMANTTLSQILFLASAPSYSIGVFGPNTLELISGGISNLSSNDQVIVVLSGGTLTFADDSTAGNNTIGYSNRGGAIVLPIQAARATPLLPTSLPITSSLLREQATPAAPRLPPTPAALSILSARAMGTTLVSS